MKASEAKTKAEEAVDAIKACAEGVKHSGTCDCRTPADAIKHVAQRIASKVGEPMSAHLGHLADAMAARITELEEQLAECRLAFKPVLDWYDGGGECDEPPLSDMLTNAVEDLQCDREDALQVPKLKQQLATRDAEIERVRGQRDGHCQDVVWLIDQRHDLQQQIAEMKSGSAFVGKEYKPNETIEGYHWWIGPDGAHLELNREDDAFPMLDDMPGICFRYTGPDTALLPTEPEPEPPAPEKPEWLAKGVRVECDGSRRWAFDLDADDNMHLFADDRFKWDHITNLTVIPHPANCPELAAAIAKGGE